MSLDNIVVDNLEFLLKLKPEDKCKIIDNNCIGCYRTGEEIRDWVWMTPEERSKIIKEIQSDRCQVLTNN